MPRTLTPQGRLDDVRVRGEDLKTNVRRAILGAPTLELSTSEVSQLSLTIDDPDLDLLGSGVFEKKTRVDYGDDLDFEVAAIEVLDMDGTSGLSISARSRGAQKMRRTRGAKVWRNQSPTQVMESRAKAAGLKFVGEASAKRAQVVRQGGKGSSEKESDWDMGDRMARELGYWAFEAAGTYYFGTPKWLVKRRGAKVLTVRWPRAREKNQVVPSQVPNCRRSTDAADDEAATVTVNIPLEQGGHRVRPGQVLELRGVPTFRADYIVTGVSITLDGQSDATVSAQTPINPEPEPPDPKTGDLDGDGTSDITGEKIEVAPAGSTGGAGGEASDQGFAWPVKGSITSPFGPRSSGTHYGIDIGCARGTRVLAAKAGTVSFAGVDAEGYGNWVEIDHGGGVRTRYGHFLKYAVRAGQKVERGQLIGYANSTGRSTGDHLHFEVRVGGVPKDPMGYLP